MTYTFCAPCLIGIESIAAGEFRRLGLDNVRCEDGRVYFDGGFDAMARANINTRYCERVLLRLVSVQAENFDDVFNAVKAVDWENYIEQGAQFPVKGYTLRSKLESVPALQRTIKKAVADRLMEKRRTKWLEESGTKIQIRFSIIKDKCEVYIDTSGAALHKRGWRPEGGTAPLRETLAAAMVDLSRFRGDMHLYDPFCGSGTIAIEAALKARRIAPGIGRRFDAESFSFIPKEVWQSARAEARDAAQPSPAVIEASDVDPAMIELARANARRAGVEDMIKFSVADIRSLDLSDFKGVIVTNPPYGERLLDINAARELYKALGKSIGGIKGKDLYVITPDAEFERCFGYRSQRKRWLYNGMIKCSLYMFFPQTAQRTDSPRGPRK